MMRGFAMPAGDDFIPKCLKLSVFFINCVYWFLGVVTIVIGALVHVIQIQPVLRLVDPNPNPSILMIMLGGILFVMAIFGCIGTLRENVCLLRWYLVFLLALLVLHLAMGVVSFIFISRRHIKNNTADDAFRQAILNYQDDDSTADFIDYIQTTLQCCGSNEYKDWALNPYFRCVEDNINTEKCSVPPSCCKFVESESINTMCGYGVLNDSALSQPEIRSLVYRKGCITRVDENIQCAAVVLGFAAFSISVPLLSGIILATRMIKSLEESIKEYCRTRRQRDRIINIVPNTRVYHIPDPPTEQKPNSYAAISASL
ncbi:tetraspanin-33-like isoform X2 [Stegodyphus dumicola]|uniref:tetraspanin-33-like isoform X2 n=1 Tax=Stegodyphus dumicola TaxID=202533 RepID=UPI0015B305DF|nr:tetraspanin-33-like isoform X2 [Stegodyphus dumicola]